MPSSPPLPIEVVERIIGFYHETMLCTPGDTTNKSLTLNFATLKSLNLEPGSMPNLNHLWVATHCQNVNAIDHFCQTVGHGIKLLEYSSSSLAEHTATTILELVDTLQGLFVHTIPTSIQDYVCPDATSEPPVNRTLLRNLKVIWKMDLKNYSNPKMEAMAHGWYMV
ncbi:uncharacterized protein MELLADRAFT_108176 [Melampsora larici-populina 98AG31]|uniref:Uncharacterized protein n=1 Tax=Melampsora larici-populina (strain 98AG31 / pathotype 3-4-7) TaxID=747676 RepID=F4RS83_MELLP|nr:uncharacterized protein MELLADRAFT_108176 [Melampsora larici-populina 98AG31]EGG04823.1 hypothetical protein MELLADRAFT_108176 [Melampsora larici-populina 98AG31]